MVGHDKVVWATIQPTTRPRGGGGGGGGTTRPSTRARGLASGLCHDTPFCIVTEARDWLLGVVSRYSLCIMTGG